MTLIFNWLPLGFPMASFLALGVPRTLSTNVSPSHEQKYFVCDAMRAIFTPIYSDSCFHNTARNALPGLMKPCRTHLLGMNACASPPWLRTPTSDHCPTSLSRSPGRTAQALDGLGAKPQHGVGVGFNQRNDRLARPLAPRGARIEGVL